MRARRGHAKALTAVAHSLLTALWLMLKTGELYRDLGNDYSHARVTRCMVRRLEALGHPVTLQIVDAGARERIVLAITHRRGSAVALER